MRESASRCPITRRWRPETERIPTVRAAHRLRDRLGPGVGRATPEQAQEGTAWGNWSTDWRDWRRRRTRPTCASTTRSVPGSTQVPALDRCHGAIRSFFDEHRGARFLLKVPRRLSTASHARPGMDLYAAVLAVHDAGRRACCAPTGDTVLRRDAHVASTRSSARATYTNLLAARWTLLLADGSTDRPRLQHRVAVDHHAGASDPVPPRSSGARWAARCQPDADAGRGVETTCSARRLAGLRTPVGGRRRADPLRGTQPALPGRALGRRRRPPAMLLVDTPTNLVIVNRGEPTQSAGSRTGNYAVQRRHRPVPHHVVLSDFSVVRRPRAGTLSTSLELTSGPPGRSRQPCLDLPGRRRRRPDRARYAAGRP